MAEHRYGYKGGKGMKKYGVKKGRTKGLSKIISSATKMKKTKKYK